MYNRNYIFSILLGLSSLALRAQEGASDKNYIHVTVPQKPVTITEIDHTGGPTDPAPERHIRSITYYDGLGRPMQELAIAASPESRDLVTHIGYDAHGRQDKQWLPYVEQGGINGSYRGDVRANTQNYYRQWYPEDFSGMSAQTVNPYSQTGYEASPLNRTMEQAAPGKDWQLGGGHGIETRYGTNTNGEVRLFEAYLSGEHNVTPTLNWAGHYRAGQLYKTVTYDENHTSGKDHSMEEFTDKQGRTVLKRTYNGQVPHDTYYVYDRYGNLSYVLPPKVDTSNGVLATELAELCYQYRYDDRNRLVEKKIPGKGWEYLVYNKGDRSVMTQDAIQRANNEWLFTKYDIFGRVAYTGMTGNFPGEREDVQRTCNRTSNQYETSSNVPITLAGTQVYYTNNAFPNRVEELHTISYYDNYNFDHAGIALPTGSVLGQLLATSAQGLSTGSKVRVLGTDKWITTITLYDRKGRPIYTATKNDYLNTLEVVETELNFTGKAKRTRTVHTKAGDAPITTDDRFTYDHVGRLLAHKQTINGGREETLVENGYDGLGQLQRKKVGGGLQTVDYAYNVRGWLKRINDPSSLGNDLFAFGINYNTADHGATTLYNGNIAETEWITANDNINRWYRYGYDALNRIMGAIDNTGNYNLNGISYDKNGNILSLQRQGHTNAGATLFGNMDALVYSHDNGNKLTKVLDNGNDTYGFKDGANTATEYTYDANGNMKTDTNKGITNITYNHMNMPTKITVTGSNAGVLDYVYSAEGIKLQKVNSNGTTTDYDGDYVYENGTLKQITHPKGYIEPDGLGGYDYVYRYVDIWGNTRLTYADDNNDGNIDASSEIRREQNYYPFGMEHKGYNGVLSGAKNDLKTYQAQEFTEDLGLNVHEWRYRMSDPATGRFWQIDPLAEDYTYNSTYAFQENKLGIGIELEGLEVARFKDGVRQVGGGINRAYREATNVRREMNIQGANGNQAAEIAQQQRISQYSTAAGDVAAGTTEAAKGGAKVVGEGLETTGDAITVVGIATAQPEIIAVGEGISTTGSVINGLVDLSDGKSPVVVGAEFGASVAFGELGDLGVKASRKAAGTEFVESGANKVSESIILGTNKAFETMTKELIIPKALPETPPATPQLDTKLVKDENNPF